ncbi:unnamed protein product [Urochloa humidicola]
MPTRKRPRNSGSSSRSSGGPTSPSPSPSQSQSAMRRTTSLSNLGQPPEPAGRAPTRMARVEAAASAAVAVAGSVWGPEMRRHSAGCFPVTEAAFLKTCGLCKSGLGPGRDTFIYLGEVAFCSQECRQHQMNLDELKEKWSGGGSDQSGKSSTIAAA